jgi:hypothetical protein
VGRIREQLHRRRTPDVIGDRAPDRRRCEEQHERDHPVEGIIAAEVPMHVATHTALVVTALIGALVLVLPKGDRLYPAIAFLGAAIEALIVFKILSISVTKLRIDLLLGGMVAVGGALSWSRAGAKTHVTAAAVVTFIGLLQLLSSLDVLT